MSNNYSDSTITNVKTPTQRYKSKAKGVKNSATIVPLNSKNTQPKRQNYSFNVDNLVKKYESNPVQVLNALGYNFSDEEKALIAQYITDKKTLTAFLNIVKQEKLTKEDIIAGVKKLKEFAGNGLFDRFKNVVKKIFEGEFENAFKLAKSERIYHAEQLGENMNEIREEREDYSPDGVADMGDKFARNNKLKRNGMHFVKKKNNDGSHLYTENDTRNAISKMEANIDDADKFVGNVVEMESITDKNNNIKYKGSTIINVADRMTQKPDLKSTMMLTAKKSDMTDAYLDNITGNLYKNPHMEGAVRFMATSKNSDGTDRFSAGNINNESNYLVDKNETYCNKYNQELQSLCKDYNMSADEILSTNRKISENPDAKNEILNKYSEKKINNTEKTQTAETNNSISNQNFDYNTDKEISSCNDFTQTKTNKTQQNKEETISYNGVEYPRSKIYKELYNRYGANTEKILQQLEKNPQFIDLMKQYGNNKVIIQALSENPQIVVKLKKCSSSLTTNELADMIAQCTNKKSFDLMTNLASKYNTTNAIKVVKNAKINNTLEETLALTTSQNYNNQDKKEKLELLSSNSMKLQYT